MPESQKIEKLGVAVLCRVSTKGGSGTYLYLPHIFCETYKILPGNVVEVYFRKVFKKVWTDEEEPKSDVIDLSKERGPRKKNEKVRQ